MNTTVTDATSDKLAAKLFMEKVRAKNAESGKNISGKHSLTKKRRRSIEQAAQNISLSDEFNDDSGHKTILRLLKGFEELCRRNKIEIPEELREQLSATLTEELITNARTFTFRRKTADKTFQRGVHLTIYQGTTFCSALDEKEFECLRYPYGLPVTNKQIGELLYPFHNAAIRHAPDPRGFLRKAIRIVEELKQDYRYTRLHDKPHILIAAAIYYPKKLDEYLRDIISENTMDAVNEEEKILVEIMKHSRDGAILPDGEDELFAEIA